jgi:hypothetical protein
MGNESTSKRTRAPNWITYEKIAELAAYREQEIKTKGMALSLTIACRRTRIDHRTIKRHAPQLIEHWKKRIFIGNGFWVTYTAGLYGLRQTLMSKDQSEYLTARPIL